MTTKRGSELRVRARRIDQRFREGKTVVYAKTDDLRSFDRPGRGFMDCPDDEIAERAPFDLGGALKQPLLLSADPRLKSLRSFPSTGADR